MKEKWSEFRFLVGGSQNILHNVTRIFSYQFFCFFPSGTNKRSEENMENAIKHTPSCCSIYIWKVSSFTLFYGISTAPCKIIPIFFSFAFTLRGWMKSVLGILELNDIWHINVYGFRFQFITWIDPIHTYPCIVVIIWAFFIENYHLAKIMQY